MPVVNNSAPMVYDDTRINVASLLMEQVGATRDVAFAFDRFSLDDDLTARKVMGDVRFTRLQHHLLASGRFAGVVTMECVRCLEAYDQSFVATFAEQFRQSVDVRSGGVLPVMPSEIPGDDDDDGEPGFVINENHQLDIGEAVRQWIVLSLPMRPDCGDACPGPLLTSTDSDSHRDTRFAGLAQLLDDDEEKDAGT